MTLGLAATALLAFALGRLTGTDWVWWLAPLTVALEGSRLLRTRRPDADAPSWALDDPLIPEMDVPPYLASWIAAAALTAGGAYTGNRLALIIGAAIAILRNAIEQSEEPTFAAPFPR